MIALDRGGIVDEYLSVPEFYGPVPPGDVIGLAANPTVLARLTGADPQRVRAVAPTAAAPAELPPARELLAELAAALGLEGAEPRLRRQPTGSLGTCSRSTTPRAARTAPASASCSPRRACPYETVIDRPRRPAAPGCSSTTRPDGRVPVLEEDGWVLPESAVDRRVPRGALPGTAAAAGRSRRARRRAARSSSGSTTSASRTTRSGAGRRARPSGSRTRSRRLDALLAATPFLTGRAFGLADVSYLPWLLRLRDLMGVSLDRHAGARALARRRAASVRRSPPRSRRSRRSQHDRRHDRGARAAARRAGARAARRPAAARSSPARWSLRATRGRGRIPGARNVDVARSSRRSTPRPCASSSARPRAPR